MTDAPADGCVISLRFWHPTMRAQSITARMARSPDHAWDVGTRSDTGLLRPTTYWTVELTRGRASDLAVMLSAAVKELAPQWVFFQEIAATGGRSQFFVGLFVGATYGETLGGRLLADLGELHVDVALDLYAGPSDRST
jgi:hypothetical protein